MDSQWCNYCSVFCAILTIQLSAYTALFFFTARRYASAVYAVVVCLCVSVCLFITLRYCIETSKHRTMQIYISCLRYDVSVRLSVCDVCALWSQGAIDTRIPLHAWIDGCLCYLLITPHPDRHGMGWCRDFWWKRGSSRAILATAGPSCFLAPKITAKFDGVTTYEGDKWKWVR